MSTVHRQSIVIVGEMNPAIHHPAWYRAESIISEAELKEALANPVVVGQPLAQFSTKELSVLCHAQKWQVACQSKHASRILEVAKATFEKLYHTPVRAYGVNHDVEVDTHTDVRAELVHRLRLTKLPFLEDGEPQASITFMNRLGECTFKSIVSASPRGPSILSVQNNSHWNIKATETTHFDLGPMLEDAVAQSELRIEEICAKLVANLEA